MNERNEVSIVLLNKDNWLLISQLSVSETQKMVFPISNVYWIGISRYEEMTELFAIKYSGYYVGLIGGGLDEDGISGYINPLMVDEKFQHKGIAREAMRLMIEYLNRKFHVSKINIGHRKTNTVAGKLYEALGFEITRETEEEYFRTYQVKTNIQIYSLRDCP